MRCLDAKNKHYSSTGTWCFGKGENTFTEGCRYTGVQQLSVAPCASTRVVLVCNHQTQTHSMHARAILVVGGHTKGGWVPMLGPFFIHAFPLLVMHTEELDMDVLRLFLVSAPPNPSNWQHWQTRLGCPAV